MSSYWVDCRRPDVLSDLTVLVTAAGALVYARPTETALRSWKAPDPEQVFAFWAQEVASR